MSILLLGTALQLATLFTVVDSHSLFWPDPKTHYAIARDLTEGRPFSTSESEARLKYSPGYPFALSLMMRVVGTGILPLRLAHVALFPLFLLALYRLGSSWGGRTVGLLLAVMAAVYPAFVYIPLTLYPEALLIYLYGVIGLLTYSLRERLSYPLLLLLGGLIAAGVLIRPTAIVWVPVAVGFLVWRRRRGARKVLAITVILFAIPVLAAAGWMVRNDAVHGGFTFSTVGALNFLSTFNEDQSGLGKRVMNLPERIQERRDAAPTLVERERIEREEALRFIRENPGQSVKIVAYQWFGTWNPIPLTHTKGGFADLRYKLVLGIPYAVFLALGIAGIVIRRRDRLIQALVLLMLLSTVLSSVFNVSVRYRIVTDFGFLLPAAFVVSLALSHRPRASVVTRA